MTKFKKSKMSNKDKQRNLLMMIKAREELDEAIIHYAKDIPDSELNKMKYERDYK